MRHPDSIRALSPFSGPPPKLQRRSLLRGGASVAAMAMPFASAFAQSAFPSQPLRVIVPFGPGGLADISTRLVAQKLSERLGQPVVIDNKPGAGGVVAATTTLAAPRDGYTLILFTNGTTIGKSLFRLSFDPEKDFVPISTLAYFDLVLLTRQNGGASDLKSLLARTQGKGKPMMIGTINPGSTQNLSAELFKSVAGIEASIVPYKSSPEVLTALLRGDVDVGFESYAALKGAIDAGQVRAIAATGPARSSWLPQVPTVREAGLAGYEVTGWNALYAASGTPQPIIELLNRHIQEVMRLAEVREQFLKLGTDPKASTPAQLGDIFHRDFEKWAKVIKQAGIKLQ